MFEEAGEIRNVVLVHGGFVDASGWQAVYHLLRSRGLAVSVVQNPTTSLADDVAVVRRALAKLDGPAVLVGHSYGGAVITEAGTDRAVAALVYVAAFAPDAGESVATLIADPPPGAPVPPILPPEDGFLLLDQEKFPQSFAADVEPSLAQFMAATQLPWGVAALQGAITQPAWKAKPTWYLIATQDRMIPPPAQRAMAARAGATISEIAASHSVYVSQPEAVAQVIATAASAARQAVTH
jgi:pimeloyl-ACP methyl ester carboxylesterase